jgi:hypothetical protein
MNTWEYIRINTDMVQNFITRSLIMFGNKPNAIKKISPLVCVGVHVYTS